MEILLLYLTKGPKIPAAFTKMLKDLYHLWQPVKLSQSVWCFFLVFFLRKLYAEMNLVIFLVTNLIVFPIE